MRRDEVPVSSARLAESALGGTSTAPAALALLLLLSLLASVSALRGSTSVVVSVGTGSVAVGLCRIWTSTGACSGSRLAHLVSGDTFVEALVRGSVQDLVALGTVTLRPTLNTVQQSNVLAIPVTNESVRCGSCGKGRIIGDLSKAILGELLQSGIKLKQALNM